jgi:hypothetical protein
MRSHRLAVTLAVLNLIVLAAIIGRDFRPAIMPAAHAAPQQEPAVASVLRGRALELVDARGQIRSRINVEDDGEVVLRLIDRNGTVRVKLGAGTGGSGLLLLDEATEPAVHIVARRAATAARPLTTSLTIRGARGEQVIKP